MISPGRLLFRCSRIGYNVKARTFISVGDDCLLSLCKREWGVVIEAERMPKRPQRSW